MKIARMLLLTGCTFVSACVVAPAQRPTGCGDGSTLKDTFSPADSRRAEKFLEDLKVAVKANDKARVASMVQYPVRINLPDHTHRLIRTPQQFQSQFEWIFTGNTRAAIDQQVPACMFANYQGAMIGDGQVWFQDFHGTFRIWSFNRM